MTLELAVNNEPAKAQTAKSFSRTIAEFAQDVDYAALPQRLRDFARFHILDVVGTALAATKFEFAQRALNGLAAMAEGGSVTVLGMGVTLPLKDAVIMNGILAHGLDYDDTHPGGPVHPSSSASLNFSIAAAAICSRPICSRWKSPLASASRPMAPC